ncbi:hypothetical protein KSX_91770 [Ktedonospora formicarum]|uniref:YHYH domain-containing protein n=1 Tax=Ktedonospora formicarum TaxID=2778364 RepID=A0A8J3I7K7_9CHLR|nr:hypothetical protein KSX_91770 [Ktedonospora formicarum]
MSPLIVVTFFGILLSAGTLQAHAASKKLTYYGADLGLMERATGISTTTGMPTQGGAWPQYTGNYCFSAVIQAITNYTDLTKGLPMRYPNQSDQGPASGNPDDAQPGQILYDLDHTLTPPDGPLVPQGSGASRRPFTLANIAYDFGGDPRSQSIGINYEKPGNLNYHEHIYHTSAQEATLGLAKTVARYRMPVDVLVNHAEHSVLVAGVWATGNPLTDPNAQISSLAVFNPWDMSWGEYLSTTNYAQVSYDDWVNATTLPTPGMKSPRGLTCPIPPMVFSILIHRLVSIRPALGRRIPMPLTGLATMSSFSLMVILRAPTTVLMKMTDLWSSHKSQTKTQRLMGSL